jgi:hypothetical protein
VTIFVSLFAYLPKDAAVVLEVSFCKGLRTPAMTTAPHTPTAGVGKAAMHEVAEGGAPWVQRALWRFSLARCHGGSSWLRPIAWMIEDKTDNWGGWTL